MRLTDPRALLGRVVLATRVEVHVFDGVENSLLGLAFATESGESLVVRGAGGGRSEGVVYDGSELESFDMAEYGRCVVRDAVDADGLPTRPARVEGLRAVWHADEVGNEELGIRVRFSTGEDVIVSNFGDDFYVHAADEFPLAGAIFKSLGATTTSPDDQA